MQTRLTVTLGLWTVMLAGAFAAIAGREAACLEDAAAVVRTVVSAIPQEVWARARCVAVLPRRHGAADGGAADGVLSCRTGPTWGAPVFVQLNRTHAGTPATANDQDVLLLLVSEVPMQQLLQHGLSLGSGASVAAGPLRGLNTETNGLVSDVDVLAYARTGGLFAGIDLSGGSLRADEDANHDVYGPTATTRTILASRALSAPTDALALLDALGVAPGAGATMPAAVSPTSSQGSTDDRAGDTGSARAGLAGWLAEVRRTLDRLIAGSDDTPVSATGSVGGGATTVTVDRAQLTVLRDQLDALERAMLESGR